MTKDMTYQPRFILEKMFLSSRVLQSAFFDIPDVPNWQAERHS